MRRVKVGQLSFAKFMDSLPDDGVGMRSRADDRILVEIRWRKNLTIILYQTFVELGVHELATEERHTFRALAERNELIVMQLKIEVRALL